MRTDKPPYATNEHGDELPIPEPLEETEKRGCEYWVDWDYPYDGPCDGTQCDLCIELEEYLVSQGHPPLKGEEE